MTKARMARTASRGGTGSIRQDERHATMVNLVPRMVLGVLALALMATGCGTVRVPMAPHVGKVAIGRPLPLEAALLIPEDRRSYIFRGKPASLHRFGS
jgi:hypothetical protein